MRRGRIITIEEWGRYATLDQTEEAYAIGGVDKSWMDYSTGSDDPDNAWDQDAYYADFEKWWQSHDEDWQEYADYLLEIELFAERKAKEYVEHLK